MKTLMLDKNNTFRVEKHQMMPYRDYEYHIFNCYGTKQEEQMTFMLRGENLPNLFEDDASIMISFINEVIHMEWCYIGGRLVSRNGIGINEYICGFGLDFELYSIDFDAFENYY